MYKQHSQRSGRTVCIEFEDSPMEVPEGISVAAAVLSHAEDHHCRYSVVSGEKRAPFCLIGVCHECLMEIDGKPYQQACMITAREGMTVKRHEFKGGKTNAR